MINHIVTKNMKTFVVVFLPFLLFLFHMFFFKEWVIDDAGISFAYAKNAASGYGLIAQKGDIPVEGYSNFLWVILLIPCFWLKLFHPIITPKVISCILILLSYIGIFKTIRLIALHKYKLTFFILSFISINTSFVIWTSSGLENPLYVLLLISFFYISTNISLMNRCIVIKVIFLAILCAMLAMTRPDGIAYSIIFPLLIAINRFYSNGTNGISVKSHLKLLGIYFGVLSLTYGSFLLFRLYYYGDIVPNTYYMKGGPDLNELLDLAFLFIPDPIKFYALMRSLFSYLANIILVIMMAYSGKLFFKKRLPMQYIICLLILIMSLVIYILLPRDWMEEFRFATPFIVFMYLYFFLIGELFISSVKMRLFTKKIIALCIILLFLISVGRFYRRSSIFADSPPTSFTTVAQNAFRFKQYADYLGIDAPSIMLPDAGGFLYYSYLKFIDLGGLCDKTIAQSLGAKARPKNYHQFYNYIFEMQKPTFIQVWTSWSYLAALDNDERFRQQYLPIQESKDIWNAIEVYSGIYVRKDAIKDMDQLYTLRTKRF